LRRKVAREAAELVALCAEHSDELEPIVKALEARQATAERWVLERIKSVEIDPKGAESGPHNTNTNLTLPLSLRLCRSE